MDTLLIVVMITHPDYKNNGAKAFINSTIPAFLFVSAFMFLIVPLTGDIDNSADAWFKFLTNFMLVLGSGGVMWYNSSDLFKKTSRKALSERVGTLNNYAKKRGIDIGEKIKRANKCPFFMYLILLPLWLNHFGYYVFLSSSCIDFLSTRTSS